MEHSWPFLVPIAAIVGAFAYSIAKTMSYARVRELEVRERIAMIERGLVPPPEKDPKGFERAMDQVERARSFRDEMDYRYGRKSPGRYRSAAITLIGIGFGLMLLISVAGDSPEAGIGVGGFLIILGAAFFINSLLTGRDDHGWRSGPAPMPPSQPPAEPPRQI